MTTGRQHVGFAKVKPNWDFWGLIDLNGSYVLEPIFHAIFEWKDGMARLEKVPSKVDVGGSWTNHGAIFSSNDNTN